DMTVPSTPTNVVDLTTGTRQIALDWNSSTDNVGVDHYAVYRNGVQVGTTTVSNYVDSGLQPRTSYVYTVRAFDAAGNQSALSSSRTTSTAAPVSGSTGALGGVVYRAGSPLNNASVTVDPSSGGTKTTSTNSQGTWRVSNLALGPCTVTISASGSPT